MAVAMSHQMFARSKQAIDRILDEVGQAVDKTISTGRWAAAAIPTVNVTRTIRVAPPTAGEVARAFTVVVTVTELAAGSVAGATVSASDDH